MVLEITKIVRSSILFICYFLISMAQAQAKTYVTFQGSPLYASINEGDKITLTIERIGGDHSKELKVLWGLKNYQDNESAPIPGIHFQSLSGENPYEAAILIPAGKSTVNVTVQTINNKIADNNSSMDLYILRDGDVYNANQSNFILSVSDNDIGGAIEMSLDKKNITEGETGHIIFTRTSKTDVELSVRYFINPRLNHQPRVECDLDYKRPFGVKVLHNREVIGHVLFKPGDTERKVPIEAIDDEVNAEPDEMLVVEFGSVKKTYEYDADNIVKLVIKDNDPENDKPAVFITNPVIEYGVPIPAVYAQEDDNGKPKPAEVKLKRSGGNQSAPLTVRIKAINGNAYKNTHYTLPESVTFEAGKSETLLKVMPVNDDLGTIESKFGTYGLGSTNLSKKNMVVVIDQSDEYQVRHPEYANVVINDREDIMVLLSDLGFYPKNPVKTGTRVDFKIRTTTAGYEKYYGEFTWEFGDGSNKEKTGSSGKVSHTFDNAGEYTVKLIAQPMLQNYDNAVKAGPAVNVTKVVKVADDGNINDGKSPLLVPYPVLTNLEDQPYNQEVVIYPNPSNGRFYVSIANDIINNVNLITLNGQKQTFYSGEIETNYKGLCLIQVNLKSGKSVTKKIMIH